ncbi:MAG TPA: HAMP domain-containing sensor histidine kinase, partial [Streptosporangiaceae bacterium]|nr:HAMP domain-containing sensor histidine kinase [Streptosporangiaceae bacterium]
MSRTRRLSLRARILVMLIGVTTVLLLVMGTVSTLLLARRVDGQVAATSAHLTQAAAILAHDPQSAALPAYPGPAVVEVPLRGAQFGVHQISAGTHAKRLADVIAGQLAGSDLADARNLAATGHLDQARQILRAGGCQQFPYLAAVACKPIELQNMLVVARVVPAGSAGAPAARMVAVLFVGEPAANGAGAVRGFIIAELITGAALIALLALAGEWLIGRGLTPLDEMTRTANEITQRGDLTARMPDADDQTEVGRLGSSINTMLDRIQQAFGSRLRSEQKVREFAADASHELRTPLTTIRGYAELYRQGALGPDQLPNAMRRIEQEAERMSTLVAELLELARLDRTSSLDLTETDLAGVVRDAVADAIAVEPRRPVHAEAPPRLVAVVDEPRIRQVLANLLGNVRAHTSDTTPVAVRLGAITGGVLIEVADAGPGMSTQNAIRAFDRFHRAAASESAADFDAAEENQDQAGNEDDQASAPPVSAAPRWLRGGIRGAVARPGAVNRAGANEAGANEAGANEASANGAGAYNGSANGASVSNG